MIIKSINITSFGGLKNLQLDFSENINIVFGKNGSGKSTVMNFIKLVLYGKTENERSTDISKSLRKKTKPLDGSLQSGSITINYNNNDYLIEKKFGKSSSSDEITITNLSTGETLDLGAGIEPGEYFTGLSLSQFERCCYILKSDYSGLETELKDIKDFSSSEEDTSGSYLSSVFTELNKQKEKYISKSKKKGLIIDKQAELSIIEADISKSLENEKIAENLDKEFETLKSETENLKNLISKANETEKKVSHFKTLKKLFELKKKLEETKQKLAESGLNENSVVEYISLGDILLQNTLTRFRMYNDVKVQSENLNFEKTDTARKKASELITNIADENTRLNSLNDLLIKKESIKQKKSKKKINICFAALFLLIAVFTSIAAFAVHDLKSLYLTAAIGIICIYFSIKAYKINKKISAATADLSFGEMDITVNEVKAMLCETEKIIKEYNCDLERIYSENDVTDFDELTEKYYAKKAEYERSDSQALKISATESSKKFISHVNECCKSETFEEAKENFEALKSLAMNTNSLKKEYNNLLEATENTDRTIQEYEALINEFSADTNIIATDEKAAAERRISILTEKMLNIKGSYPKECKSVYELKHSEQNAEAELSKLNETYSALLMAEEVLKETYNEISHGFIPKVNKTASEFLSELESNKNSEMIITDNVIPKVKKDSAGDFIHSGYMSESEKERIYLALRLAIISAIETDNKLPIIADDIFSSYDNDLKEQAIKFLISFSKNRQVIFFTCHENEKNIFGDTHRKLTL